MTITFTPAYNFYELKPAIYLVEIDGNCDLAYTFLRVQEFYESGNDNIRGHAFTWEEYKAWYCSQSKKGTFSYGDDWRGFNVPSSAIEACYAMNTERTEFDTFFLSICEKAKALAKASGYDNYYVLGVRKGATDVLYHELAHGLFATHADYRQLMETAIASSDANVLAPLYADLTTLGYGPNVHHDEAQAYLSTGLRASQGTSGLIVLSDKFKKIFQTYLGEWKLPEPLVRGI